MKAGGTLIKRAPQWGVAPTEVADRFFSFHLRPRKQFRGRVLFWAMRGFFIIRKNKMSIPEEVIKTTSETVLQKWDLSHIMIKEKHHA